MLADGVLYRDRRHAGEVLATRVQELELESPVVVALPRGGVPVGYEVARALDAPLDIGLVRKLGAPGHPEFGIGALGEGGTVVLDRGSVTALGLTRSQLRATIASEQAELDRRRGLYRPDFPRSTSPAGTWSWSTTAWRPASPRLPRRGCCAHAVREGSSSPCRSARRAPRRRSRVISTQFVTLASPEWFTSVGAWYADFSQTSDREVVELLATSRRQQPDADGAFDDAPGEEMGVADPEVSIPTREGLRLNGSLAVPTGARGLVIFVHGSGSSRRSPRNLAVARQLNARGLATLLFDLLTDAEAADRHNVFDIDLLTRRLVDATGWAARFPELRGLPFGYFGASTGAAAALRAAAGLGGLVGAVVSRGGRPDLAGDALSDVIAPTLLIVGGYDWNVLELNDEAATSLGGPHELAIVPGAGHLFEEPGALEQVGRLAAGWFAGHLTPGRQAPAAPTTSGGAMT